MKSCACLICFLLSALFSGQSLPDLTRNRSVTFAQLDSTYRSISADTAAINTYLKLSRKNHNEVAEVFFLNQLGSYFRDKSTYAKADFYHRKALNLATRINHREQIIISTNLLGVVYRRKDEILPAIEYHQKALEMAESTSQPSETILRNIAISCNSLGNVYLTMNQLEDAMTYFQRSLEIEKKINNLLGLAINYHNIGGIYEKQNDLDGALYNYRQSLNYNHELNSALGKIICNNSIGGIYLKKGETAEAAPYLAHTIAESEKIQDEFYISISYIHTGWLQMQQKNPRAEQTIKHGLSIAERKGFTSSQIEAYDLLSQLYQEQDQLDSALAYYKKYAEEKELLHNESTFRSISDLKNRYTLERRKNEINALQLQQEQMAHQMSTNAQLYTAAIILLAFLAGLYYFYTRQKELKQQKKLLQMEQDILNLQMNPHFIFNALNSIKAFIVKNDTHQSVYYLNKFSKIFRNILTGIQKKETNLKEELENVENYLSIENMRFGGAIQYTITIDEALDTETIKIPSFLLQVFAENAVWHGLALKEGEKKLSITVSRKNDRKAMIEIRDNGIGLREASRLAERNQNKKESLGFKISRKRLERLYAEDYSLRITDLETDGSETGTLVHLEIPYN